MAELDESKVVENALRATNAAIEASSRGWYLMSDHILVAINPDDSSEVWTFFHAENVWKRKGEEQTFLLRDISREG